MNKVELISKVAKETKLTSRDATEAIEATIDNIIKALQSGDEVRLVGFGIFSVSRRKASEGRNPRTGETIKIPASKNPKFRPGKILKQAVNG
ncbi:MAG TPA: HU family DNA-binding protein [Aestuariivirgaceae bacterium]|jgi:DNA-binding protein HU-beta